MKVPHNLPASSPVGHHSPAASAIHQVAGPSSPLSVDDAADLTLTLDCFHSSVDCRDVKMCHNINIHLNCGS
jgi:hypothetical protein